MPSKKANIKRRNKKLNEYYKPNIPDKGDYGNDLRRFKKSDKSERVKSKQDIGVITKSINQMSKEKYKSLKEDDNYQLEEEKYSLYDVLDKVKTVRKKRSEKKDSMEHSEKKEIQHPDEKDEVADKFIKNFTKLSVTSPTELIKAIFPEYAKRIEEDKEKKANGKKTPTKITFDELEEEIKKEKEEENKKEKDKDGEKSNPKKYSEELSSIKRLKYLFDNLDIDEIFIGKEGFYGALAFTMKDNDLTIVENFLDEDQDGNKIDSYGHATYIITKNHMFDLLTRTRTQVQEISEEKGYRCERIIHSSKNYYNNFDNSLYELKHTSDVRTYSSITPLKGYNPTEEELTRGDKLCDRFLEGVMNDSFEEGEEEFLRQEIDKLYDKCIKRRESYLRKHLEVTGR